MKEQKNAPKLVKVRSRAEVDLAGLTEHQQNSVRALLKVFLKKIQEVFDSATVKLDACHPHREKACGSCAFVEKNDWPGLVSTAYSLCHSIANGTPFICHRNHPKMLTERLLDRSKLIPCEGYVSVRALYPEKIREVALLTMEAIEKIKSGPKTQTHSLGEPVR